MKTRRFFALAAVTALLAAAVSTVSFGAVRRKIEKVDLTVEVQIAEGASIADQQAEITVKSSKFDVEDYSFINDGFQWYEGDVPRIEVRLSASEGCYFATSDDGFTIHGGAYVEQEKEDYKETVTVTIDLPKVGSAPVPAAGPDGAGAS